MSRPWRCVRCNSETVEPQLVSGVEGKWQATSRCPRCDAQNFHSKHGNWLAAAEAWRRIGVNADPRKLADHYERNANFFDRPTPLADALMEEIKKEPRGNVARNEGGQPHGSNERPVGILYTNPRPTTNQPQNEKEQSMNIHEAFPNKFLKAADLSGRRASLTIERVELEEVAKDKEKQPVVYFRKQKKGLVLNKTNALAIEEALGQADTDEWEGQQITLFPTRVDFQGKRVAAIRVEIPENGNQPDGADDDIPF